MLQHVAPDQTRFVAPGLAPDTRGVALGRFLAVLVPSIDRVVGLFRGLSEALSLDELLPSLRIVQVRTPLQSREFIVLFPVNSSYGADQLAAVAALVGGLSFTGTAKHFIKYRDSHAPLGHDVDSLHDGQGDFILYGAGFVQAYAEDREVHFPQLALSLSLQRDDSDRLGDRDEALLRVAPGLWRAVLGYLHRNGVPCAAASAELLDAAGAATDRCFLIRCPQLPARMAHLFGETPGVELMRIKLDRVAVQVGYRHPIELSSCATVFPEDRFTIFSGARDVVEAISGTPTFVDAGSLVALGEPELRTTREARPREAVEGISVPLLLVPTTGAAPRVVASRIPLAQAGHLKKLVYALPPSVLAAYSVCVTDEWIYLWNPSSDDYVPLGEMFFACAPGVLIPIGYQIIPRVDPDVLITHLGGSSERVFFGTADREAVAEGHAPEAAALRLVALPRAAFAPLCRAALAAVALAAPAAAGSEAEAPPRPSVVNRPVGLFPLWGFSADDGEQA